MKLPTEDIKEDKTHEKVSGADQIETLSGVIQVRKDRIH